MTTRIAGIQPGYLPWLGYFDQMRQVDAFLIADELPFTSSGWAHRNRIKGPDGPRWLTLPVRPRRDQPIAEVPLDRETPWARKHRTAIRHCYADSAAADEILPELEKALDPQCERLVDASLPTIRFLAERLGVETPILVSSELALEARYAERFPERPGPTHRIVAYLEALGADELLEGASGRDYLDVALCAGFGKRVVFHDYRHPSYAQLHGPFVSHLSALDLVLCEGAEGARRVLRDGCGGTSA